MDVSSSPVDVRKTSNYKKGKNSQWEEKAKSNDNNVLTKDGNPCSYCGRTPSHPKADCPAKGKDCNKFGKSGLAVSVRFVEVEVRIEVIQSLEDVAVLKQLLSQSQ